MTQILCSTLWQLTGSLPNTKTQHSNAYPTETKTNLVNQVYFILPVVDGAGEDGKHVQTEYLLSHCSCQYWCTDEFLINEKVFGNPTLHEAKFGHHLWLDLSGETLGEKKKDFVPQNIDFKRKKKMNIKRWDSLIIPTWTNILTDNTRTHTHLR